MRKKKNKKDIIENVLPEELEKVEIKIDKIVDMEKAIINENVDVTNMLKTKDVK